MHVVVFYMYTQLKKILPHLTYTYRSLLLEQSLPLFVKFGLGERQMTANVHSLLHLPEVVRSLGPLWAHSCFPYEDANGELLTLFHGSHAVEKQVSRISLSTNIIMYLL